MVLDNLAELRDFESTVYITNQFKLSIWFIWGASSGRNGKPAVICTFTHSKPDSVESEQLDNDSFIISIGVMNYSSGPKWIVFTMVRIRKIAKLWPTTVMSADCNIMENSWRPNGDP